jgi:hypothetical protein
VQQLLQLQLQSMVVDVSELDPSLHLLLECKLYMLLLSHVVYSGGKGVARCTLPWLGGMSHRHDQISGAAYDQGRPAVYLRENSQKDLWKHLWKSRESTCQKTW